MKAHRTADHFFMPLTAKICPRLIQLKGFIKGHTCKLGRNRADFSSRNTGLFTDRFGGVLGIEIALDHMLKDTAVGLCAVTVRAAKVRANAFLVKGCQRAGHAVNHQLLALAITQQQTRFCVH